MTSVNELIDAIAEVLAGEKAYDLRTVCNKYGLEDGAEVEAWNSKRTYVQRRLKGKDQLFLLDLARRIIDDYGPEANSLTKLVVRLDPTGLFSISEITRRNIMDELYIRNDISGQVELTDFLNRVWNLNRMRSTDNRFTNAAGDIFQHMINNSDWDERFLYEQYLEILTVQDDVFINFLEQVVHPLVRKEPKQGEYVEFINKHLVSDGYKLSLSDRISGFPVYKTVKLREGVRGRVKNLIFAAVGAKPEIVLDDSLNNDIKIVRNEGNCLVYDRYLPNTGLLWLDLVRWWADMQGTNETNRYTEGALYKRLYASLGSEPEKLLFRHYFQCFRQSLGSNLPALIPQVYLHYDPYTIKRRDGKPVLSRQRMDFLVLFSNTDRVVIEVDGKQHYSEEDTPSPRRYAEMVSADRQLRLNGYEVYRFGGFELGNETASAVTKYFFANLFDKHKVTQS